MEGLVLAELLFHPGAQFVVEQFLLLQSAHEFDHHVFEVVEDATGVALSLFQVLLDVAVDVAQVTDDVESL